MPPPTTAMILAAGLGTRLRPLTDVRAKPAVPVAGRPLVRRIVGWLAGAGVTDVVVNLHHRPASIAAVLGDGADLHVRVRYSWEPELLGSAGGPRRALDVLGVDAFWLVNGDTLATVDLAALDQRHRETGARVTLAVAPHPDPHKYGGVRIDGNGFYTGVAPRGTAAQASRHFTGVQIVTAGVFRALPPDEPAATIGGAYDALLRRDPHAVATFTSDARFYDIGTPADYVATSRALAGEASGDPWRGRGSRVDPSATLRDTIVWDDVTVGASAHLDGCIVTDGVCVPPGAVYRRAVLIATPDGGIRAEPF